MNIALFLACIKNPDRLRQVSYQELKTLVYHFPYAANLRQLLWEKSQIEDHQEKEKNLHLSSMYSINRSHLEEKYRQLIDYQGNKKKEPTLQLSYDSPSNEDESVTKLIPKANDFFSSWNESVGTPFTKVNTIQQTVQTPIHKPVPIHQFKNTLQESSVMAERSVQENSMPVSETYAKLLVQQNQIDKAIEVYHRLILIFPKKSTFFAGEIENLKNL
jgi:hypothetical protein